MNAVVVTFDRLPEAFLGCCGNGWIDTPNFDRLAAQSAVFAQHFAEYPVAGASRHAWFTGRYECRRGDRAPANAFSPARLLVDRGITVRLLSEATTADSSHELACFPSEYTESVIGSDGLDVPTEDTPFLRLAARAQRDLRLLRTSRREPWLLWIKSRGVPSPWLAPRAFASRFLDIADEPADEQNDESPKQIGRTDQESEGDSLLEMSPAEFDELLRSLASLPATHRDREALSDVERGLIRKIFGGYVALLDTGLGQLLEPIEQAAAASPTLLIVTAALGADVRAPGILSSECGPLAEETVHTPLFVRPPDIIRGRRRQVLTQPVDIVPTLFDWFGVDAGNLPIEGTSLLPVARGQAEGPRARAFCGDGQEHRSIRTPDYYLVARRSGQPDDGRNGGSPENPPVGFGGGLNRCRLFAKPEDTWELNDLAPQMPDFVEELSAELESFFADGER